LAPGNISKLDATRCQISSLKCTKFDFRWGSTPDPAGGVCTELARPLSLLLRAGRGKRERRGRGREGEWKRRRRKEREGEEPGPINILA